MSSRADFLRSLPYFATLEAEEIKRIEKDLLECSLGKGELLFLEGAPCQGLYAVRSGQIRIFKSSS